MKIRPYILVTLALAGCTDPDQATIDDFVASAYACLQEVNTEYPIFQGCIDWGSAVAAHWAVLRYGRMEDLEDSRVKDVLARLDNPQVMGEIRDYLRHHPRFEMPYGRAWLLALAREYQAITGRDTLALLADSVQRSLLSYYTNTRPDPLRRDVDNDSWGLVQLYLYYEHTGDEEAKAWVGEKVRTYFERFDRDAALTFDAREPEPTRSRRHPRDSMVGRDSYEGSVVNPVTEQPTDPGFFSLWGNWAYLLSQVDPGGLKHWIAGQQISERALTPITEFYSDHHIGMNISRAWGLWWAYKVTGQSRFRSAYNDHVEQALADYKKHSENYWSYGHWAPQFGIYALSQPWAERRDIR
jgi:hypothetical protein